MHLIYARFFTKVLRDLGFVKIDEPFTKLFNQGMLHGEDGFVMSKSRGNVILPEEISKRYGIDTARFFLMSIASPDKDLAWNSDGIEGSFRFINKVIEYFETVKIGQSNKKIDSKINKTIKEVTEDIENFRYNFAIIKLRQMFESLGPEESNETLEAYLKLLHPFCPHITEEIWHSKIGRKTFLTIEKWPAADESKIDARIEEGEKNSEKLASDINGVLKLMKQHDKTFSKVFVYAIPKEVEGYIENKSMIKTSTGLDVEVYAVNDKNKYDPQGKAAKTKPGKPAIYME
jgi:leucyl-tRNA synthetase